MSDLITLAGAHARHDLRPVAAAVAVSLGLHGVAFGLVLTLAMGSTGTPGRLDAVLLPPHVAPVLAPDSAAAPIPAEPTVADLSASPREMRTASVERAAAPRRPMKQIATPRARHTVAPVSAPPAVPRHTEPVAAIRSTPTGSATSTQPQMAGASDGPREAVAQSTTPPRFQANYLANSPPAYPLRARRDGIEGTVMLKVMVTASGAPGRVEIEKSSGSAALDHAALDAVKAWRFVPARRGEQAVDAWIRVPVEFRLESG